MHEEPHRIRQASCSSYLEWFWGLEIDVILHASAKRYRALPENCRLNDAVRIL